MGITKKGKLLCDKASTREFATPDMCVVPGSKLPHPFHDMWDFACNCCFIITMDCLSNWVPMHHRVPFFTPSNM